MCGYVYRPCLLFVFSFIFIRLYLYLPGRHRHIHCHRFRHLQRPTGDCVTHTHACQLLDIRSA